MAAAETARVAIQRALAELLVARSVIDVSFGRDHAATRATDEAVDLAMIAKLAIGRLR